MNFYVEDTGDPNTGDPNNKRYYIHSWVNNPTTSQGTGNADYLGVEPLMDTDMPLLPRGQVGKPYIIKVGKEADIETKNDVYTFPWGINTNVKVNGPIYQVKGVAISSLMATSRRLPT